MTEIVNCSRCRSENLIQEDFGFSKNGERLRTCTNCRLYSKQRKHDNREAVNQQAREYYQNIKESKIEYAKQYRSDNHEKLHEVQRCQCGGKYIYRNKAEHEKSMKHKRFLEKL